MAHDVFISYATKDKPIADAICAALESERIRCWIAPRDVIPGKPYAGEITRAIDSSKVMVLLFSSQSNVSGDVLSEVQLAAKAHVHILNFRIEDVPASDEMNYYLGARHWLDAMTAPLEAHLAKLTRSVGSLLGAGTLEGVESETFCIHCGMRITAGNNFCTSCGKPTGHLLR